MNEVAVAWDKRYSGDNFVYGVEANQFLKESLAKLPKGKILFPAEGEGRNAVYAAMQAWDVSAYDLSEVGAKKALSLAKQNGVEIAYRVGSLFQIDYVDEQFDAIALIFAHFAGEERLAIHQKLTQLLKQGGSVIFEGFSKKQIAYQSKNPLAGGPRSLDLLFSIEEIEHYFPDFDIIELEEKEVELKEGELHIGKASVIRFVGTKK